MPHPCRSQISNCLGPVSKLAHAMRGKHAHDKAKMTSDVMAVMEA